MTEQEINAMVEQFKSFSETDQNWLLSFLDFWQEHPVDAGAFLDRLCKET